MPDRSAKRPKQAGGNAAIVVLCNSSLSEYAQVNETMFAALGHFGMPFIMCDLAKQKLSRSKIDACAAIVIGQDNLGLGLSRGQQNKIVTAVKAGTGLVNFDYNLANYDDAFLTALGAKGTRYDKKIAIASAETVTISDTAHFITGTQEKNRRHRLRTPIPMAIATLGQNARIVAKADNDSPACFTRNIGKGKLVQWLVSPRLWTLQVFGHAHGLDDLFWKGIVWAARKPFAMHCMPPFVRFRFDDCNGLYRTPRDMAFVKILNDHGHKPNMCVCMNALKKSGWRMLKKLYDQDKVEVAPHTWKGGESLYFGLNGKQYSKARFKRMITKTAALLDEHGIVPSKILSDHEHEYSARVLPYLDKLGIEYKMNVMLPGETWAGRHCDWHPAPYGSMSYALDYTPGPYPLFVVFNHYPAFDHARSYLDEHNFLLNRDGGYDPHMWDFLNGLTTRDRRSNDIDAMADRLAEHTRLGLNSLFFGGSISHSHFTQAIAVEEWRALIERFEAQTSELEQINVGYDDIAEYARSKFHSHLSLAERRDDGKLQFRLSGTTKVPMKLSIFTDKGSSTVRRYVDVAPFSRHAAGTA